MFKKILLIKLINFLSNFKKKKINKTLFVSIAGIGDLFLSIPLIKNISILDGDKIDILINENALSIVNKLDYIANIYYITSNGTILCNNKLTNMNFNSYSLIYSNRISNQILAYLFYKGTFIKIIPNPLYEKLRLFSRFYSKISNSYRKNFYSKFHILDLNKKMFPLHKIFIPFLPELTSNSNFSRTLSLFLKSEKKIILIHVGGKDQIRKFKKDLIENIIENVKFKFILVGDETDRFNYSFNNKNVLNMIGNISLDQIKALIENVDCCIVPDSLIMHIASITNTPIIAIMGNALEETFGPIISTNKIVLSRLPTCSPCSRIKCDKYSGFSCVQDFSSQEIHSAINKIFKY